MGLEERRKIKELQETTFPERVNMSISFDDGVLDMRCAYALRTEGMFSDSDIRSVLMARL
jgi:hypothetical protein